MHDRIATGGMDRGHEILPVGNVASHFDDAEKHRQIGCRNQSEFDGRRAALFANKFVQMHGLAPNQPVRTLPVDVTVTELPRYGTVKGMETVLLTVMLMNCS